MTLRTTELSSFPEYLATSEVDDEEIAFRESILVRFPYSVILKVSFAELDFANRWCWQAFGPCDGECLQRQSEYRVCEISGDHFHVGNWRWNWFEKIAYDFGFNEWYFLKKEQRDQFLANVKNINWGELYPKFPRQ